MTEAQKFTQVTPNIYIIEGHPIEFCPGPYNLSDPKTLQDIQFFARNLYDTNNGFLPRMYGDQTVAQFFHGPEKPNDLIMGQGHISQYPKDVQDQIKAVMEWQ